MSVQRNTLYNLSGSVLPLAGSLITIPYYIDLIGTERYGVLAIVWLLLGYFGIFDLGLGRATAHKIASLKNAEAKQRAEVFLSAVYMNTGLGIIGGLLVWPIAQYAFSMIFQVEGALREEVLDVIPWMIPAIPIALFSGTLGGSLQGREKFLDLNIISMCSTLLFQTLPLLSAFLIKPDLNIILPTVILVRLITLSALYSRCRRYILLGYKPGFNKQLAKQLLQFGGWVSVSAFLNPLLTMMDRFIIGAIINAKYVTYYAIPFQFAERTTLLPNALTTALFPRFSSSDEDLRHRLARESLTTLACVMTPIYIIGIYAVKPFLNWWLGAEFAENSSLTGQILLLGFFINGLAKVPLALIQSRGKPGLVAKCHLIEVIPYFILLYFGMRYFDLPGAAAAFVCRNLLDLCLLAYLGNNLLHVVKLVIIPIALFASCFYLSTQQEILSQQGLLLASGNFALATAWGLWKLPQWLKDKFIARRS